MYIYENREQSVMSRESEAESALERKQVVGLS